MIRKKFPAVLPLLFPAVCGAIGVLAATPHGIGLHPDSIVYVLIARSLSHGNGWTINGAPTAWFPPFYPTMLTLGSIFDSDLLHGARWMQAFLFACNIFWVGMITYRF